MRGVHGRVDVAGRDSGWDQVIAGGRSVNDPTRCPVGARYSLCPPEVYVPTSSWRSPSHARKMPGS